MLSLKVTFYTIICAFLYGQCLTTYHIYSNIFSWLVILNFNKSVILGLRGPSMAMISLQTKFGANGPEIAKIHVFMFLQDGGRNQKLKH